MGARSLVALCACSVHAGATVYPLGMDYHDIISIVPGTCSGKPIIRGLRITVQDVLEYLAGGMSEDEILADSPDLTH